MSQITPDDRDRARALMMARLDGEITTEDGRELDRLIAADPALAAELTRLSRVKEVTSMVALRTPSEEVWDGYWKGTYRRAERGLGWLLIVAGGLVLAGWWLWHLLESLWADTGTPVTIRLAVFAVGLGILVLLVSVIRERLVTRRHDPYDREVLR